jgi:hypothetical protein
MSSNYYEYCYCSACKLESEGCSLQLRRTIKNHEKADARKLAGNPPEIDEDVRAASNPVEEEDFGDLFEQHNHYPHDNGFDSDASHSHAHFSLSSNSDSDIDRIMPQFEEPDFSDSDEEQGLAGGEGEDVDLLGDPLFRDRGSIFGGGESEDEEYNELDDEYLPPAFQEHPAIRNAYIRAFLLANLKGSTHDAVQIHLEGVAIALRSAESQSPDVYFEGLTAMARTLATAERRLGISTDQFITYFFLCDVCWKLHHPSDLPKLQTHACDEDGCTGKLSTLLELKVLTLVLIRVQAFGVRVNLLQITTIRVSSESQLRINMLVVMFTLCALALCLILSICYLSFICFQLSPMQNHPT